jgi:hypothetical protein
MMTAPDAGGGEGQLSECAVAMTYCASSIDPICGANDGVHQQAAEMVEQSRLLCLAA